MTKQGYRVLVAEKGSEESLGKRYDIFHLEKKTFEHFNMPFPKDGASEFVETFSKVISRSAKDRYPKSVTNEVFVMHRHEFMNRMKKSAIEAGVEYIHNAEFVSPSYNFV